MKKIILIFMVITLSFYFSILGKQFKDKDFRDIKKESKKEVIPKIKINWIKIPAGSFIMGDDKGSKPDQKPEHSVYLSTFYISKHEITVDQFKSFIVDSGYVTETEKKGVGHGYTGSSWVKNPELSWRKPGFLQTGNHPVVLLTWKDSLEFCKWLSAKTGKKILLPTEAQWEKAARGTDQRKYPWGNNDISGDRLNFADKHISMKELRTASIDDGYKYTSPVGSFPKGESPYGVMDMAGNAWEWIRDLYDKNYYSNSPGKNPLGPTKGPYNITRGGSWGIGGQFIDRLKSGWRNINNFSRSYDVIGFRIVKELQ